MRILMTVVLYFISIVSIGQNIYSPVKGNVILGDPLEKVLGSFKAKRNKNGIYSNKEAGYSFALNKSNRLEWFSADKPGIIIGDGSIRCGMQVKDLKLITTRQQVKKIKLFGQNFLFLSGINNFPETEFIIFLKDNRLVKQLRAGSETPYRSDNGMYNVPLDLIPSDLKINSIRVTQTKM